MNLFLAQSGVPPWLDALGRNLLGAGIYTVFGVIVFSIAFVIMTKLTPFSVRKEIEEDQNTSLAIIMGSIVIGLAIIIAAAVHG